MKKIFFFALIVLVTFLIYSFNINDNIYYLSIGDYLSYGMNNFYKIDNNYSSNLANKYKDKLENYVNYSFYDDYRVMDLINDINYNETVRYGKEEYKLQNLLIKSNIITISIGMNDLIYKKKISNDLNYEYVDQLLNDIFKLFKLLRKYNKDKIYFMSFYNVIDEKDIIKYANNKLKLYCEDNNIIFVDISLLNNYILKGIYPTNDGYTYITEKLFTLLN